MNRPQGKLAFRRIPVLALVCCALLQVFLTTSGYSMLWLKRSWRNRHLPSMERNALFLLGGRGADFIKFISSVVPYDRPVLVPEGSDLLAEQSILQFFLMPRAIPSCVCGEFLKTGRITSECKACLQGPDHYLPSIGQFPPEELVSGYKEFIPFPRDAGWYHGIYVPPSSPQNDSALFILMRTPFAVALVMDSLVVLSLFVLGVLAARLVVRQLDWIRLVALGIPLGGGVLTWIMFLVSWAGVPITVYTYLATYLVLLSALLAVQRQAFTLGLSINSIRTLFNETRDALRYRLPLVAICSLLSILFVCSLVISIGRGYSLFDGIANWAVKGYGIALEGNVYAGREWGGHSLSYPQNIHLLIALFRTVDGDVLPGSKSLFPLFGMSLILGSYSFWRRGGMTAELASLGALFLLSVPYLFLHSTIGWGNLTFACYLVLAVYWLVDGVCERKLRSSTMGGILLGLAAWTRPEGVGFAVALTLLFGVWTLRLGRREIAAYTWMIPVALIVSPWLAFKLRLPQP